METYPTAYAVGYLLPPLPWLNSLEHVPLGFSTGYVSKTVANAKTADSRIFTSQETSINAIAEESKIQRFDKALY